MDFKSIALTTRPQCLIGNHRQRINILIMFTNIVQHTITQQVKVQGMLHQRVPLNICMLDIYIRWHISPIVNKNTSPNLNSININIHNKTGI